MLKRKIEKNLSEWKNQKKKKCLVVNGARQVGKTYSIVDFAKKNYSEVLSINFKETPSVKEVFSGDLDVNNLLFNLKFRYPEYKIEPGKTLIFFDEIQECEEAITSLKFWSIDNRFDVIASGSMLGIDYKRASSYPVGYVDYLYMYGLDFEEFLWAKNVSSEMIEHFRTMFNEKKVVPLSIHNQMLKYLYEFMAIGGMPEIVQNYIDTNDLKVVHSIQKSLLQGYLYDIAHYASSSEKIKAEKCFLSLSNQLLDKENHKFQYKEVEKNGKAQKFFSSLEWLERANIISKSLNVSSLQYDLTDYEKKDNFRIYTSDLSLLVAMRDYSLKQQIFENNLIGNSKGGFYECFVADALIKKGYKLHFYKNEHLKLEIEFLIQKDGQVIPIEVKGGNAKATSLLNIMKKSKNITKAYKLINGNIGESDNIITAPLYMIMFI